LAKRSQMKLYKKPPFKALSKFEGRLSLKIWLLHLVRNGTQSRIRRETLHISLDEGWGSAPVDKLGYADRLDVSVLHTKALLHGARTTLRYSIEQYQDYI
jgi:hypothetical protein